MNLKFWKTQNIEKRSETTTAEPVDYGATSAFSLLFGQQKFNNMLSISAVYACISLISNSLASLPIFIKHNVDNGKEVDTNHNLNVVFNSMLISKFNYIKKLIVDLLIDGNAYSYIKRGIDGRVVDIIYLSPRDVNVCYDKRKQELYYRSTVIKAGKIEPINMIHLYKDTDDDGVMGKGFLTYAKPIIDLCGMTDESARKFFTNGMACSGILTTSNPTLSSRQSQEAKASWNKTYGGGNSGGVAVLPQGWSYSPISSNANEAQLLESRLFNVTEICRYFNVNPVLVCDLSKSSYNTFESAMLSYVTQTLMPYITLLEGEFTRKLLLPSEYGLYTIDLDETEMLRGDHTSTSSYLSTLTSNGILTVNEARKILGYNAKEGADDLVIPFTKIEDNTIGGNTDKNTEETQNEEQ